MPGRKEMHEYQNHCVRHLLENPYAGLLIEMGLGKSIVALTALIQLLDDLSVSKILIIAPKRVAEQTWPEEIQKWDHTRRLRFSLVLGDVQRRLKGLRAPADVYIINRENVAWLVSHLQSGWDFDCLVIDELSSFKAADAIRFKSLRMVRPKISRVIGLTGTPAPNGLIDLWPQLYLLDMGERLGKTISGYRNTYFRPGKTNGHIVYTYALKKEAEAAIHQKIEDICISMSAKDYLQLPERINNYIKINLACQKEYLEFERIEILKLSEQTQITALNAAGLTNKLLQFCNGAIYDEKKEYHEIHNSKIDALKDIVDEAQGRPVLVFYSYQSDYKRIEKHLKIRKLEHKNDIQDWNQGRIPILLAHPASAGHGLNLQAGGNVIVWFGLPWSLELYAQANARLDRQGQTKAVIVHHLVAAGTMDEDVMGALARKKSGQEALMDAVKFRIEKYKTGKYVQTQPAIN